MPPQRVKELNKYDKRLKKLLRNKAQYKDSLFYNSNMKFFHAIISNAKEILRTNTINVNELHLRENVANNLINYNRKDFDVNGALINNEKNDIILKLLQDSELFDRSGDTTFGDVSKNVFKEAEVVDEYISFVEEFDDFTPSYILLDSNEKTNFQSVLMNLWIDNDIIYAFKDTGVQRVDKKDKIQTNEFFITQKEATIDYTTCYEATCNFQNEEEGVCGRKVTWCDAHLSTNVKCTNDTPGEFNGHKINTTGKGVHHSKFRTLYVYRGYDIHDKNEEKEEILIYSIFPITQEKVLCNTVTVYDNKNTMNHQCIIAVKDELLRSTLKEPILQDKDNDSFLFLNDLYDKLKDYFKKYHDITITNQNSIVAKTIILQLLIKLFYNKRVNSLIIGGSGTGKTFFSKFLIPMFTFNYSTVFGTQVTRNRFLGGRSGVVINGQSTYNQGYMAVNDCVFCEESTDPLNDYINTNRKGFVNIENNLFSMFKLASQEGDVGIQGSQKFKPRACAVLVGNLEQLEWLKEYHKEVRKKYYNYANKSLNPNIPLFKSPLWYNQVLQDEELGKAHVLVRSKLTRNYITQLPPAEQARFSFMLVLEDSGGSNNYKGLQYNEYQKEIDVTNYFHRKEFFQELEEVFQIPDEVKEQWKGEEKKIFDWMKNEYFPNEPNNFKLFNNEDINMHIVESLIHIGIYIISLHKMYTQSGTSDLHEHYRFVEDDKERIRYFYRFNYNSLSKKEASEIVKPYYNTVDISKEDVYSHDDVKRIEFFNQKEAERQQIKDDNSSLSSDDVFDNVPEVTDDE